MRLRNIPGSRKMIVSSEYVIQNIEEKRGRWKEVFGNSRPIYIEIGMGKGKFLIQMAEEHADMNFIGIEKYSSVLLRALEKRKEIDLPNLFFIRMDAETIPLVFAEEEVAGIYLNFSDPWPKERHAKRRLTSKEFLARYDKILRAKGQVAFKTDNKILFDFSVESVKEAGWELHTVTRDLHNEQEMNRDNIMTEYEEKFSSMGNPIYKLIAERQKGTT